MTLKQKMEARLKALEEARDIRAKAQDEKREMTSEELATVNAKLDDAEKLGNEIDSDEKFEEINNRLDTQLNAMTKSRGRKTEAEKPGTALSSGLKENIQSDPKKGFKNPRAFMMAVMQHGRHGKIVSGAEGLKFLQAAGSDEQMEASDPYGGFLVPEAFTPNLLKIDPEADPTAGRTTMIPMSSPTVKIPARVDKNHSTSVSGGLTVSRRMETAAASASRMKFEQVVMDAFSLFGVAYATEEILSDSPISFAALLSMGFSEQFTSHMIDERLNGNGVGEYLGVMNSGCLVTQAKEGGQAADTIKYENIIKMRARCWGYDKAIWLANHDTLPQLMTMAFVATAIGPIWQPSLREDHPDLLLGRPIIFTEYAKTLGDAGDIVLGNWSQYLEGVYQPLQSSESIHVRFLNHERTFKFWTRNAGQCWWKSALTPKNSSTTLSPFVVLEAR